ncbi:DUF6053 domain-containing protein [Lysobacter sp. TAB13]|uniref:DUF6053 domain-containing protein n=1 Tax=Lysobacter sp. TAB13 TaxID=3233065 RepID=UPI003F98EEAE
MWEGALAPMFFFQIAASGTKSIGAKAPSHKSRLSHASRAAVAALSLSCRLVGAKLSPRYRRPSGQARHPSLFRDAVVVARADAVTKPD